MFTVTFHQFKLFLLNLCVVYMLYLFISLKMSFLKTIYSLVSWHSKLHDFSSFDSSYAECFHIISTKWKWKVIRTVKQKNEQKHNETDVLYSKFSEAEQKLAW